MTTQHIAARACEHLVFAGLHKSAEKDHIRAGTPCRLEKYTVNQACSWGIFFCPIPSHGIPTKIQFDKS